MKNLFTKLTAAALAVTLLTGVGAPATIASAASKPAKVSSLTVVDRDDDELNLKWSKVSGANGYQLYRYNTKTGKWTKIKTTSKTSYEVEDLKAATKYQFRVRAYDKVSGKTVYGSYSSTLTAYTAPDEVKNLSVSKRTNTAITLKWNKVSGATKYQVYLYNTSTKKYVCKATVSGTTATIKGLSKGTTYKFKVRAYKTVGSTKYYGDFSDTRTATTTGTKASTSTTKDIGSTKAKSIALNNAGLTQSQVRNLEVEKDKDDGVTLYEVSFDCKGYEYEYDIHATSGKILHKEKERD